MSVMTRERRLDSSQLSFAATVPRVKVHREAVCEVFLTDSAQVGPDSFVVGAQLPRVHSFYSDFLLAPRNYDPLLLAEVCRQSSILLAHEYFGVPLDQKFVLNHSDLRVIDRAGLRVGDTPGTSVVEVTVTDRKLRGTETVGYTATMHVDLDGRSVVALDITIQWMPGSAWNKLRERGRAQLTVSPGQTVRAPRAADPSVVGRLDPANVVIGTPCADASGFTADVVVDQSHAALFDHPLDHIPGVLLQEACRQLAVAAAHDHFGFAPQRLAVETCHVAFSRFGEFELPTTCRAEVPVLSAGDDSLRTRLTVSQDGVPIAAADIGLALVRGAW
ncbi:ScbA/BarX family gamma-butyrolactone biosynthesis protein [Streptomyces sp. NPDC001691]|uniref:ScbA/BarX family gamma-butyrolactone biosynthesis protein n=1 Tax=Streptomyces sp. NPDC001691 TaxID=3364600 RepID=UPI003686046D